MPVLSSTQTQTGNGEPLYVPTDGRGNAVVSGGLTVSGPSSLVGDVSTGSNVAIAGKLAVGGVANLTQAGSINCKNALQVTGTTTYSAVSTDYLTNLNRVVSGSIAGGFAPLQVDSSSITLNAPASSIGGTLSVSGTATMGQVIANSGIIASSVTSFVPFIVPGTVTNPLLLRVNTGGYASGTVYVYPTVAGGSAQMARADFAVRYGSPTEPIFVLGNQINNAGVDIAVSSASGFTTLFFNGTPDEDMTVSIVLFTKVGSVVLP